MQATQRTLAGRYELHRPIGRGGMGTVYRATDRVLSRTVAVKVLPPVVADADPVQLARFEREGRAAASLSHPGVVAVYDAGSDDATRYIVMELVSGRDLSVILSEQAPLAPAFAAAIGAQVADALAAAHAAGIVHRDIKPANVMVDSDGAVTVLDFGIARAPGASQLTEASTVLGTATYMAPEQAEGRPADARSDIYSLGCLLYALLTGRPPFTGATPAAVARRQLDGSAKPPRRLNPRVPASLDALVMAMLAKNPAERPQTAADVARCLRRLDARAAAGPRRALAAATIAVPRRDDTVTRVLSRPPRRRSSWLLGLAVLGCAAVLALLVLHDPGGQGAAAHGAQAHPFRHTPQATARPATTSIAPPAAPAETGGGVSAAAQALPGPGPKPDHHGGADAKRKAHDGHGKRDGGGPGADGPSAAAGEPD
jgi:serine/threonine protein kinase